MSARLRRVLIISGGAVLALVLALVVTLYLLLRPDRFTALLEAQAQNVGLELHLAQPASPTLFPRPALDLRGITLNAQHSSYPILLAARGRLALPWRTLFGGPTAISQLEIEAPRVDVDALQAWLDALPPRRPDAAPEIPRIDAGVRVSRGSIVRGNRFLLGNVELDAGNLHPGQPFTVNLSAQSAAGTPLSVRLTTTPRSDAASLRFDDIALRLAQGDSLVLLLGGSVDWHGLAGLRANLTGKLDSADGGQYDVALASTPPTAQQPSQLRLKLDGAGNHVDVRVTPQALADWQDQLTDDQDPALTLPPGDATIQVTKLDAGGVRIEGLSITAGADVPGAAASVASPAAAPARPATAKPAAKPAPPRPAAGGRP